MSADTTTISDNDILKLFDLETKNIDDLNISHSKDGIHVFVKLALQPHVCPVCGNMTSKVKTYYTKTITHSVLSNVKCVIDYKARRFICPHCHKTFYENNPFAFEGKRISYQTVYNVLGDLKDPRITFAKVAKRYNISASSAAAIFDQHVNIPRRHLSSYLCIDEVYAFKSYRSKYVCVLLDYSSQNIIDVLPSRHKADLINYFSAIPRQEREKVKLCSFDMWETYRTVCHLMFPNALQSVDHFHVIQELNHQVDKVRIRVMNRAYKEKKELLKRIKELTIKEKNRLEELSTQYYALKKFNWMIFTNNNRIFDPNQEKRYNAVFKRYMNYDDILSYMLGIDTDLETAYEYKYALITFYQKCTTENAKAALDEIIIDLRSCKVAEMNKFANTLSKWKYEIINSLIIVEEKIDKNGNVIHKRLNNGIIENRNKSIKLLKHSSNGYLNWKRFRNRILYSLNSDSTFFMFPTFKKNDSD